MLFAAYSKSVSLKKLDYLQILIRLVKDGANKQIKTVTHRREQIWILSKFTKS